MEFGQSLILLNACILFGFTAFAAHPEYQKPADRTNKEILVSSESYDPGNHVAETETKPPTLPAEKPGKEEGRSEGTAPEPHPTVGAPLWTLLPLAEIKKANLIEKAYLDVVTILKEDNSCSRFYGGSSAIGALNEMVRRLTLTHLDRLIAIRMQGETSTARDYLTGRAFRLFEKAEVNLSGPFFKGNTSLFESRIPSIGSFQPNTREARAAILLHELGHVLLTPDKKWILPDDGNDQDLSRRNTERVFDVCRDQIAQISHLSLEKELDDARGSAVPQGTKSEVAQR